MPNFVGDQAHARLGLWPQLARRKEDVLAQRERPGVDLPRQHPRRGVGVKANGTKPSFEPRFEEAAQVQGERRPPNPQTALDPSSKVLACQTAALTRRRFTLELVDLNARGSATELDLTARVLAMREEAGALGEARMADGWSWHPHDTVRDLIGLALEWIIGGADLELAHASARAPPIVSGRHTSGVGHSGDLIGAVIILALGRISDLAVIEGPSLGMHVASCSAPFGTSFVVVREGIRIRSNGEPLGEVVLLQRRVAVR